MTKEQFKKRYPNIKVEVKGQRDGSSMYVARKARWVLCRVFDFDGEGDPYGDIHRQIQDWRRDSSEPIKRKGICMDRENTPTEAIARAMEQADGMTDVLILYVKNLTDDESEYGTVCNESMTNERAICLMEMAKFEIIENSRSRK